MKSRQTLARENKKLQDDIARHIQREHDLVAANERADNDRKDALARAAELEEKLRDCLQQAGRLRGRIEELARAFFTLLRTSMRKDGMPFEDIERIVAEHGRSGDFPPETMIAERPFRPGRF